MRLCDTQILIRPDIVKVYFRTNAWIIFALFVVSNAAYFLLGTDPSEKIRFLTLRLMHDDEYSLPTLYNFALVVTNYALVVMALIQSRTKSGGVTVFWAGFAVIFLCLAYDEAAQVHEKLIPILKGLAPNVPAFHYPWTPIGALFAIVVALVSIPHLKRLPKQVAILMVLSGGVFLIGALGVETIGGMIDFEYGRNGLYFVSTTLEESIEMLGMVLFGCSVLLFLTGADS